MPKSHPATNLSAGAVEVIEAAAAVLLEDRTFVMIDVQAKATRRTRAALYKSLENLVKRGLVSQVDRDYRGKHYAITKVGEQALAAIALQRRMVSWEHLGTPGGYFFDEEEAQSWRDFEFPDDPTDAQSGHEPDKFSEWESWRDRWLFHREVASNPAARLALAQIQGES